MQRARSPRRHRARPPRAPAGPVRSPRRGGAAARPPAGPRARPARADVEDRGLEGEPDRALGVLTRQADAQRAGPALVVDHDGQVGVRPVAHANAFGFEPDRRGRDRRQGGPLHPVPGRLDLVASVGGRDRERPVHLLTGRRHRGAQLRGRGALDAGRHPQLDGPEHEFDPLLRVVPDEARAPFPVAPAVVHHDLQLGDGAVVGAQRARLQPEPHRDLDRRGRRLLDQPYDGGEFRPVVDRPHGEGALGAFPGGGRRRHDPHLDGGTAVGWDLDHRGVELEAHDPLVVRAGERDAAGVVGAAVVQITVNRPRSASFTRTTAGSVRIRTGPPIRGTTSTISTSVCTRSSLSGRTRTRRRMRWATTGVSGRTSSPIRTDVRSPGSSLISGTVTDSPGGGRSTSTRFPSTIDEGFLTRSSTPPLRAAWTRRRRLPPPTRAGARSPSAAPPPLPPVRGHPLRGRQVGARPVLLCPARGHAPLHDRGRRIGRRGRVRRRRIRVRGRRVGRRGYGRLRGRRVGRHGRAPLVQVDRGLLDRPVGTPQVVTARRAELHSGRTRLAALGAHALCHPAPRRTPPTADAGYGAVVRSADMHTSCDDLASCARTCSTVFSVLDDPTGRQRSHRACASAATREPIMGGGTPARRRGCRRRSPPPGSAPPP